MGNYQDVLYNLKFLNAWKPLDTWLTQMSHKSGSQDVYNLKEIKKALIELIEGCTKAVSSNFTPIGSHRTEFLQVIDAIFIYEDLKLTNSKYKEAAFLKISDAYHKYIVETFNKVPTTNGTQIELSLHHNYLLKYFMYRGVHGKTILEKNLYDSILLNLVTLDSLVRAYDSTSDDITQDAEKLSISLLDTLNTHVSTYSNYSIDLSKLNDLSSKCKLISTLNIEDLLKTLLTNSINSNNKNLRKSFAKTYSCILSSTNYNMLQLHKDLQYVMMHKSDPLKDNVADCLIVTYLLAKLPLETIKKTKFFLQCIAK